MCQHIILLKCPRWTLSIYNTNINHLFIYFTYPVTIQRNEITNKGTMHFRVDVRPSGSRNGQSCNQWRFRGFPWKEICSKHNYQLRNIENSSHLMQPFILELATSPVSEWVIKFNGLSRTADSEVHIVHISRVIIACTLKSLSPPT